MKAFFAKFCPNNSKTDMSQDSEEAEADEDFEDVGNWEDENLLS